MTDLSTFEARFAAALDRYADRMPVAVDARAVTHELAQTRAAQAQRRPIAWPTVRLVLLIALVAALVAGTLLIAGRLIREPSQSPLNGPILMTRHGDPNRLQFVAQDGSVGATLDVGSPWHCPHLLPGGRRVAYWTSDGALSVVATDGGAPTVLDRTPYRDTPETKIWQDDVWRSDSSRVALPIDGVRIIDTMSGAIRQVAIDTVVAMAWAPDGDLTIARQIGGDVQLTNLHADDRIGPEIARYAWDAATMGPPRFGWSATGSHLAYLDNRSSDDGTADLVVLRLRDNVRATVATGVDAALEPASIFSPDGDRIAVATGQGLVVMDPDGANRVAIDPIDAGPWSMVGWSPDGTWIALMARGRNVAVHPDGTGMVTLTSSLSRIARSRGGGVGQLSWAPDSSMLVFTSEGYGTHSISTFPVDGTTGTTIADFESDGGGMNCLAWPAAGG